jgi:uncharacterized membrane protein YhaH (DUF805 family)
MTFTQAITTGFRKYADFRTRSSRSEYWWWTLFSILVSVAATLIDEVLLGGSAIFDTINTIVLFVPGLAVAVRRLHDIERSGWWFLIAFTIIGIFLLLYWYLQPGTVGTNKYGSDPLRAGSDTGPAVDFAGPVVDFDGTVGVFDHSDKNAFCSNCGTGLEPGGNFCRSCGQAI